MQYSNNHPIEKPLENPLFQGTIPVSYTHLDVYKRQDLAGNVLHITPQSGDTINPLISGPIVTIIPEKIKLSYTLLDQARVSLSRCV